MAKSIRGPNYGRDFSQLPQSENIEDRRHLGPSWDDVLNMLPPRADALQEWLKDHHNMWLDFQTPTTTPLGVQAGFEDVPTTFDVFNGPIERLPRK